MNEQALRFRVGIFVLAAMILLGVLIMLFGSFPTMLRRHNEYTVTFLDAPGVSPGTPVRRAGVRIGEVKKVQLDDAANEVHLDLLIEREHPLYEGDEPVLVHGLLTGDTSIDLVAQRQKNRPQDLTPIPPGSELKGKNQADVSTLLNQTSGMVPRAEESLIQINKTLQRLDRMSPLIEDTLREYRDLARAVRESVPDLRRTNDEAQITLRNIGKIAERADVLLQTNQDRIVKMIENASDTMGRIALLFSNENRRNIEATLKNLRAGSDNLEKLAKDTELVLEATQQTMKRFGDTLGKADQIMVNLDQATRPFADRSAVMARNLEEATTRFNALMGDAQAVLRAFGNGNGSLRRFIDDPDLYNNLNQAACMLARIMPRVDRILKDFEVFADKVARHPEQLGIGGAVSPSSGLK